LEADAVVVNLDYIDVERAADVSELPMHARARSHRFVAMGDEVAGHAIRVHDGVAHLACRGEDPVLNVGL
jgi:hypothetical protein